MKGMALAALPLIFALTVPAMVDARTPSPISAKGKKAKVKRGIEYADSAPMTRIRETRDPNGLTPLEFAKWLRAHPALATDTAQIRRVSAPTRLLNRSSQHFAEADRNGDGRVSADELADFVQPETVTPMRQPTPST